MTQKKVVKSRLAPTPSGLLHPGNGLSFILTWALTRAQKGSLLLRIDDLDKERCRDTYLEDIFRTIDWLGIDYDEGPSGVADFKRYWSQHQRLELYQAALHELRQRKQVFACDCSRKKIRALRADGTYPNICQVRKLSLDRAQVAWRFHLPTQDIHWQAWPTAKIHTPATAYQDAFVVRQKNGRPAYQLASLIDDLHFGINWIIRGEDLRSSTIAQLRLAHALDKSSFLASTFYHHPLLLDENGRKLSKSKGAGSLQAWRNDGRAPTALYSQAARILGIEAPAVCTAKQLVEVLSAHLVAT